jgi:hypothetical protein
MDICLWLLLQKSQNKTQLQVWRHMERGTSLKALAPINYQKLFVHLLKKKSSVHISTLFYRIFFEIKLK